MAVRTRIRRLALRVALGALAALYSAPARGQDAAQPKPDEKPTFDIYGFVMLDVGQNFKQIDPNWFDTLRVTRLPKSEKEFGENDSSFASVRQTRFGVKSSTPVEHFGALKTIFEFEMFGTGVDEGQTTIRLRHAWGELGKVGAGQYWSPFTDPDAFPNSLEYWGPTGIAWYRNVQFRYTPVDDGYNTFMIALERPGASGDQGNYANRIELSGIKARFPMPDATVAYRIKHEFGYFRFAAQIREINWDDTVADQYDLSGSARGWGINLSSGLNLGKAKKDVLHLAVVFGEGIENAMNDSPVDIGIKTNSSDPVKPLLGTPLPIVGTHIFLDHTWNKRFTSTVGYGRQDIKNSNGQAPDAFHVGQYALGNVLYSPAPNAMMGGELQWGRRENNSDGFHSDGLKFQFSFKYNFAAHLGGQ